MEKQNLLIRFLWVLVLGLSIGLQPVNAHGNSIMLPGINPKTGQSIWTDLWGKSPIVEFDPKEKEDVLGAVAQLGLDRKSLEYWIVFGITDSETNAFPNIYSKSSASIEIKKHLNGPDSGDCLGKLDSPISFDPQGQSTNGVKTALILKEGIGQGRAIYLYTFHFSIPLKQAVKVPPEMSMWAVIHNLWQIESTNVPGPATEEQLEFVSSNTVSLFSDQSRFRLKLTVKNDVASTITNDTSVMPGVQLSITRTNGFLFISFSPSVDYATLEEADPNSASPLKWQTAVTETNHPVNGWYVSPAEAVRIYRLRIGP